MKLKLIRKDLSVKDIITFYFDPEEKFEWISGQYLHYRISQEEPDDRGQNRFFSIASAPHEGHVQLTTRISDDASSFKKELSRLEVGDIIEARGPMGDFSAREDVTDYVFIAGGIGITPFRSIILDFVHKNKPLNITLLYANKSLDAVFKEELEQIAEEYKEFKIYYFISGEKKRVKRDNIEIVPGRIDKKALENVVKNITSTVFYVSGPETMVYYFEDLLASLKVPGRNIVCDYFVGYESY